jgi:hypothetical protein
VSRAVKIPQDDRAILATRRAQGSIGGDGEGGNVAGVSNVVSLEGSSLQIPDLYLLVTCSKINPIEMLPNYQRIRDLGDISYVSFELKKK